MRPDLGDATRPFGLIEANPARVVDFVATKAEVGGGGNVGAANVTMLVAATAFGCAVSGYLAPILRVAVFLGEPHFGHVTIGEGVNAAPKLCHNASPGETPKRLASVRVRDADAL